MADTALSLLRRINAWLAILVGIGLLGCAAFVLADILLRQVGASFGGTDEISGYVMAIATSWGMAYTMLELGHVRIDLLRSRLASRGRVMMDLLAQAVLAICVTVIAWQCWPVLANSLANGSTANTPLETPLAWVQGPWFAGWAWFAAMAWATLVAAAVMTLQGRLGAAEAAIGAFGEQEAQP
ncbi:TRAP transporter small permease [Palleronia sediminis]|uniref:TRAP transporter small permease protein n=1 Tax=Palleronia sediminis TaxID=2547833 RepID=A0A4R6A9S2_9RHOB|nr:TRAP transporter small permease [Palleronia sediminis]TDL79645.1 TRAP transporter small permease [Palleronia sediminis]